MEIKLNPIPLLELIQVGGDELQKMLRSFCCVKNNSIESFLHDKAVLQEKEDRARTTLILDDDTGYIVGYYTLKIESFVFTNASGKVRKQLAGKKEAAYFNCILIAKIGGSDKYKGKVKGEEILKAALYSCSTIKMMTAIKIVCVEYIDEPVLKEFYEKNEFKNFQRNENGLNISFIKI